MGKTRENDRRSKPLRDPVSLVGQPYLRALSEVTAILVASSRRRRGFWFGGAAGARQHRRISRDTES